ncbi:symplekin [Episyrphus balteatus]|uniref:symplekin n=1 Tax=Episyrphus balteatus TaxID=286459 RepID=UPI002486046E|nr:symplekin [Episyrphus balteatus]
MSGILGRTQFLGETSNLFTDERTATARSRVVEWFNEMMVAEPSTKCELLAKIQEIILGTCPELIEEFLEHILSFAHDAHTDVRKQIIGFMEQICKLKPEFMPQIVNVISMLLRDSSAQVIKRVIQACGSVYKNGLQWICTRAEITDSTEQAWNVLSLVKAQILDMIDNDNDGIRTNALKFLEGVVILQTYPDEDSQKRENDFSLEDIPLTLKIMRRRKLEEEAMNIFDILLKFHAATHVSSVNLIACTGSLSTIAKMRPCLMSPVVEAFKSLSTNLPPTLTDSQVSSVRKSLKMQLIGLLKNRGSFEFQNSIKRMLLDLGASQSEISRATPKMDKQEVTLRQKRIVENAAHSMSKKMRLDKDETSGVVVADDIMEVDIDALEKNIERSNKINEKFIAENIRNPETAVSLVLTYMKHLPNEVPDIFFEEYVPIKDTPLPVQITKIASLLSAQMTEKRIGPGAAAFPKEPETNDVEMIESTADMDEQQRKEEATKKLRENMERVKGEQALLEHMKQRAKTLKLQEVTKPFPRATKAKFLVDAVKRILSAERQCIVGGVSVKRRKILTVMAATFPDSVRLIIFDFIMMDIKGRIDLAFSWLYEEYCLLQGFTRHSYVKSEHRPDYAYNDLLNQIINGICTKCDFKDKLILLRRVYLEAPLLSDESVTHLVQMCLNDDTCNYCVDLIKDLAILRPPRKLRFVRILLNFCVHDKMELRERALDHVRILFAEHKVLPVKIEEFAIQWINYLVKETPPAEVFGADYGRDIVEIAWKEDLAKICLGPILILLPHSENLIEELCAVYTKTSPDLKRTVLRSIEVPIKKLGVENSTLLKLIEDCPKGVETLVTRIIYILSESTVPTSNLVKKVRDLYQTKVNDVRLLIPVLSGLTKTEILTALPKLLKLNPIVVKEVFNRLLAIGTEYASQKMPISPSEILVSLHTLDQNKCELKYVVKATSLCLAEKEVYTQDILGACLQQLVDIVPIPTLFMRTVIQSLALYPRLSNFIIGLLQRLILKQVWKQKLIWEGFLKCCQRLKPQSSSVLIQLPLPQLQDALNQCPDLRAPLLEYAESVEENQAGIISQQTMDILTGNALDVIITDDSGGFMMLENIKVEKEDPVPVEPFVPDHSQPLPPGED